MFRSQAYTHAIANSMFWGGLAQDSVRDPSRPVGVGIEYDDSIVEPRAPDTNTSPDFQMLLIPTVPEYATDTAANIVWGVISTWLGDVDGEAYYRHPNLGLGAGVVGDFTILARTHGAIAVVIVRDDLDAINAVDNEIWRIQGEDVSSPLVVLDDLDVELRNRFDRARPLRNRVPRHLVLFLPSITQAEFEARFGEGVFQDYGATVLFRHSGPESLPAGTDALTDGGLWRHAQSVFQTADGLTRHTIARDATATQVGPAVRLLDRQIALFDDQQKQAALQIPPGPQCIRGLAGTGKTALLAIKAATIHGNYPDKDILFTFNTQSLYNQTRDLITRFYRLNKESDPDWTKLHIRHGWGGRRNPGVYSDLCARQGIAPVTFQTARQKDSRMPFRPCCTDALSHSIKPAYDFVLVDEAQDFPAEFFQVLYRLTRGSNGDRRIYYAYDEFQSLADVEIPTPIRLFGVDENGVPRIDLDGQYDGPIDKTIVLQRSYRCPLEVLMLAHAIGLGVYSAGGCVQMISDPNTWSAIGYEIESGTLEAGTQVSLVRSQENSPNQIGTLYTGQQEFISVERHDSLQQELQAVAASIAHDVNEEDVAPERILVISLEHRARDVLSELQYRLIEHNIASVIPGLVDGSDAFAEEGRVTLSTVFRAKGNEAPIVYIVCFDRLIDYVHGFKMRNNAFTAISRSKGWLRISGSGAKMVEAEREISAIRADLPRLRFTFPDMREVQRNLDQSIRVRQRTIQRAQSSLEQLANLDDAAFMELSQEQRRALLERLRAHEEPGDGG
ncbi:MAG: hypothetical protein Phyf2KO_16920 [Phycisphaerales bacterium]